VQLAPIALFTYNRLRHIKACVRALQENEFAGGSDLFVFSDGPRTTADERLVASVRGYISGITGFNKVHVIHRETNMGLSRSIISGITSVVERYGRVIVMEDDLVSCPYFLKFMNEGLEFYRKMERVISIHGYVFPVERPLPETFFRKGADCWGWATWERGWRWFDADGERLLFLIQQGGLEKEFDCNGAYPYTRMLLDQTKGKNDSWAIRWYASAFLAQKLTLYPGRSLIRNIGMDDTGVHSGRTTVFDAELSSTPVEVTDIPLEESLIARELIERYLRRTNQGVFQVGKSRIIRFFLGR
jgi:hypothetical protein